MIDRIVQMFCDVCGSEGGPFWSDGNDVIQRCTDCYLRLHGYDPDEVGQRFAEIAKAIMADFINLPIKDISDALATTTEHDLGANGGATG